MPRQYIYLRLLEKTELASPDSKRLLRVQSAIERLGDVEWAEPPSLHPKGGYRVCITLPAPLNYAALLEHVDREGYWPVF